jgi:hypothetical protein
MNFQHSKQTTVLVTFLSLYGVALRALYSTAWATPPAVSALHIFQVGTHVLLHCSPGYTSRIAGMIGMCHHAQIFIGWDGDLLTYLNAILSISVWNYRHELQCTVSFCHFLKIPDIINSDRERVYFDSQFWCSSPWLAGPITLGPAVK